MGGGRTFKKYIAGNIKGPIVSRRGALGIVAGAIAAPSLLCAQQPCKVQVIIQYGTSYLPFMVMKDQKFLETALRDEGAEPRFCNFANGLCK